MNVGSKTNDDYLVTMVVTAQLPKERVAGKDEKPEDKARLDKEFKDAQQKLADKLKQEQGYEKWTYLVPGWVVDPILKHRGELLAEKKEETKPATGASEETKGTNQVESAAPAVNH